VFIESFVFFPKVILAVGVDDEVMQEQNTYEHTRAHCNEPKAIPENAFDVDLYTLVLACFGIVAKCGIAHTSGNVGQAIKKSTLSADSPPTAIFLWLANRFIAVNGNRLAC
jgi:hypothetical protein